jgi:hypothetical protein
MYHIILIALAATMMLGVWNLVQYSPRALVLLLPGQLAFYAGAALLIFGVFFAFAAAVLVQNGEAMLAFLFKAHVGLFFMLVPFSDDQAIVRRAFAMMATIVLTLLGIFFFQNPFATGILMSCMLGAGYYVMKSKAGFLNPEG